jgi:ABC-type antimicrobial peptide transport system permease subunit
MSLFKFIGRNIRYYWRQHFALFIGTAISTAVLTGALIVGDSVRLSLAKLVDVRLGNIRYALQTGERFVRWELAEEMGAKLNVPTASLLMSKGIAINPETGARANRLQVIGVDSSFWALSNFKINSPINDEVIISNNIATELGIGLGDLLLLRVDKMEIIPVNAPFAQDINPSLAIRLRVKAIAGDSQMGRFSLSSNQATPYNVFVSSKLLANELDLKGKANVVLVAEASETNLSIEQLNSSLKELFSFEDAGLTMRELPESSRIEVLSQRIFIDEPVEKAIISQNIPIETVLTYLANSFNFNGKEVPYSFVSAASAPIVDASLLDNEIIVNQWLANDLGVLVGDSLNLKYFIIGPLRTLREVSKSFRVKRIIPIQSSLVNNSLMPLFPGLADAGSCHDWETGMPIDLAKIRDKDEKYWNDYRGTPKALVSMQAGRNLWGNPFGKYTAIRIEKGNVDVDELKTRIAKGLNPIDFGLSFIPVYSQGVSAASNSVDFGSLFISLSFFLIAASILLTVLIYSLNTESRKQEIGVLSGLGFDKRLILKIRIGESFLVTLLGGVAGAFMGIFYTHLIVWALNSVWQGAVHTNILEVFAEPSTVFIGAAISVVIAFVSIYFVTIRKLKQPISTLIRGSFQVQLSIFKRKATLNKVVAFVLLAISLGIVLYSLTFLHEINPTLFLTSGGLFLGGCIVLLNWYFRAIGQRNHTKPLSLVQLAIKNSGRNKNRSLATIILLALGTFIIIITGANRKTFFGVEDLRQSGTGGFLLWTETTLAIPYNLNTPFGKAKLGLEYDTILNGVSFVQLHRLDGDDASCLNLNQVKQPAILGVKPEVFDSLGSFSFATYIDGADSKHIWLELQRNYGDNVIPVIADQTVLTWGIMKSVGDTLNYINEAGETIKLLIVAGLNNSIFQGNLLISNSQFTRNFPSTGGSSIMLVNAHSGIQEELSQLLSSSLTDYGVDVKRTSTRLAQFNTVENTYLTVFMVLGGLGIIIGTFGLGVVLLRNMLERKSELALMLAVGFRQRKIFNLILFENLFLLTTGLALGTAAAFIGILPSLLSPSFSVPIGFVAVLLVTILLSGIIWIYIPTRNAVKGNIINGLREE